MNSYRPPMLGFEDFEGHAEELAPIAVRWADGTPICGILGDPAQWAKERAEQKAREAFAEEIRTLHENVVLLDDYRNRTDDHRETL
jgi:hypothetical protein